MSDQDILEQLDNTDLDNVDTSMPVAPKGIYTMTVSSCKVERNKANTGSNVNIELTFQDPPVARDGKQMTDKSKVFHTISLVKTDKYDPLPKLAMFREGVTGSKAGKFLPTEQYVGLTAVVSLDVEESDQYGTKNVVKKWLKQAAPAAV